MVRLARRWRTPLATAAGELRGCSSSGALAWTNCGSRQLGMLARIEELLRGVSAEDINDAFWQSCHGGQGRAAELLREHGADLNWVPDYAKRTPLNVADGPDTGREALLTWLRDQGAQPAGT